MLVNQVYPISCSTMSWSFGGLPCRRQETIFPNSPWIIITVGGNLFSWVKCKQQYQDKPKLLSFLAEKVEIKASHQLSVSEDTCVCTQELHVSVPKSYMVSVPRSYVSVPRSYVSVPRNYMVSVPRNYMVSVPRSCLFAPRSCLSAPRSCM